MRTWRKNLLGAHLTTFEELEQRTLMAVLAAYDFTNATGDQVSTAPASGSVAPHLTASAVTRGTGVTPATSPNSINSIGWTSSATVDLNDYYSFGVWTPESGYSMTLTSIGWGHEVQGRNTGIQTVLYALRSSLDGFTSNVGSGSYSDSYQQTTNFFIGSTFSNLTAPIEFRLYAYRAIPAPANNVQVRLSSTTSAPNGVALNGTVDPLAQAEVSVGVSPSSVTEDGAANLSYTFTRTGSTTSALTVNFSVSGAAVFGTDYAQSGATSYTATTGSVTIPSGSSSATVTINPTADQVWEADESVVLTASAGTGYTVGGANTATGTIINDDTAVLTRQVFYNNSKWDGNGNNGGGIGTSDDLAIATDKSAYLPGGGASTFANMTSYNKGINGVMIDLAGPHSATLAASDFIFRVGNNNTPNSWVAAPTPTAISLRPGAGTSGSDRVEIVWADGAIKNQWLEVIVDSGTNTGLIDLAGYPAGQGDVFFFGNKIGNVPGTPGGDSTAFAVVGANDQIEARGHLGVAATRSNLYDFDHNKIVDANDELIARGNAGNLRFISVGNPPLAPDVDFVPTAVRIVAIDDDASDANASAASAVASAPALPTSHHQHVVDGQSNRSPGVLDLSERSGLSNRSLSADSPHDLAILAIAAELDEFRTLEEAMPDTFFEALSRPKSAWKPVTAVRIV